MKIGFAANHGGYVLKERILKALRKAGHTIKDFGAYCLNPADDYPDFVIPLARPRRAIFVEVARGLGIRGILHRDYETTQKALETMGLSLAD